MIEDSNASNREATAILDRKFFIHLINEYKKNQDKKTTSNVGNLINLSGYSFTKADFTNISYKDFKLFNFNGADISKVKLDRVGLDYFLNYMKKGSVKFNSLKLTGVDLSTKILFRKDIGVLVKVHLDLTNLDLKKFNFEGSNIENVIFDNSDIELANFINTKNILPEQFIKAKNYEKAIFDKDYAQDKLFKDKIIASSKNDNNKIFLLPKYNFIAKWTDDEPLIVEKFK